LPETINWSNLYMRVKAIFEINYINMNANYIKLSMMFNMKN